MASSGKRKGSVRTVEWWRHLKWRKRDQNKLVRQDGKKQIEEETEDTYMEAIITIGIPCSGKSTWAEDYCNKNGFVEINRDNLRMSLFSLERYDDYTFSRHKEQLVTVAADQQIEKCAERGQSIIISDTNLNKGHRENLVQRLKTLGYDVKFEVIEIEFFDALKRNDKRTDKKVPRDVMYRMYRNFMDYQEQEGRWTKYVRNTTLESAYIVDIDGTLASNDGCRGWYDWAAVGKDKPIEATINIVNLLHAQGHKILLLSGRDSVCRKETEQWLKNHGVNYDELHMRPEGSMKKDRDIKERLFAQHVASKYNVQAVFDDRPQVCLLWHDLGLPLFKVGDPLLEF